jgi:hypothetical protein
MRRVPLYPCGHRYGPNYGHLANKRFNLDNRASPVDRERIRVCGFQQHHSVRYSINSSPFATPSPNNGTSTQINTTQYRLSAQPSPGAQYAIRFKAWSDAGACAENDVNITVTGAATTTVANAQLRGQCCQRIKDSFHLRHLHLCHRPRKHSESGDGYQPGLEYQRRLCHLRLAMCRSSLQCLAIHHVSGMDFVLLIRAIRKPGRPACGITYRLRFILPGMEMFITISLLWTGKQRSSPECTAIPHEAGHGRRVCCRSTSSWTASTTVRRRQRSPRIRMDSR